MNLCVCMSIIDRVNNKIIKHWPNKYHLYQFRLTELLVEIHTHQFNLQHWCGIETTTQLLAGSSVSILLVLKMMGGINGEYEKSWTTEIGGRVSLTDYGK